jgi:methionyl-tRNA formyltransferase
MARRTGLPLAEVETVKSGPGLEALAEVNPDVMVVVAYGEILPPVVLALPRLLPVNLHFSLLPALRGPAPVQYALLRGLAETGVTTMAMDEGVDTGGILLQRAVPIAPEDDAGSLGERLAAVGGDLLVQTLDRLAAGDLIPTPQDGALATYAPKLTPDQEWVDWSENAGAVVRLVRALAPQPGASTRFRGSVLKVFRAREEAADANAPPGSVVATDRDGLVVAAGAGAVRVLEVAPSGRRRMPAADFARGRRPQIGEVLEGRRGP